MTASSLRFGMAAGHLGTGSAPTLAKAPYSPPQHLCAPLPQCRRPLWAARGGSVPPVSCCHRLWLDGGREGGAASAGPENRSGASGSGAGSCPGTGGKAFCKAAVAPSETCHHAVGVGQKEVMLDKGLGSVPHLSPVGAL